MNKTRLRTVFKHILGRLSLFIFPTRARKIEQNIANADGNLLDRIIRFGLICRSNSSEKIAQMQQSMWAGEQGSNFTEKYGGRFQSWFISRHISVVDELEKILGYDSGVYYYCLYEIGCGDGQVLNYLSSRLKQVNQFVGIDINKEVIAGNNRRYNNTQLRFFSGNALDWICKNSQPRSIFFSNGGVLEYFSEREIVDLLGKISTDLKPALFAIVEPVALDYDFATEKKSRPYGVEWSFAHNYPHLFKESGYTILYQQEETTGGIRWILMVAQMTGE
jgi:SAM-dependent methyltransferase